MKTRNIYRVSGGIVLLMMIVIIGLATNYYNHDNEGKRKHFKELIGEYSLDLKKSKLKTYTKDSVLYKDLEIKLRGNSTFGFNKNTPFLFDTCGKWVAVGYEIEKLNEIIFENCSDYDRKTGKYGGHFTQVYSTDSIFSIIYISPQPGKLPIGELYFKRIKH
jgi:hypothetical protein